MSSKKKRSRSSALSSPYVSRLPSTDRRLSRAAGTTAVAAERSDPARDMGLQPAGPGRADFFGLLLWGGQQTLVGPRENLERLLWIRLHFRLLSPQVWRPCLACLPGKDASPRHRFKWAPEVRAQIFAWFRALVPSDAPSQRIH